MATVYVITKGSYSDYHICAVALDRENAKRLCKLFKSGYVDKPEIEEWDTEKYEDLLAGRIPHYVTFLENGDVYSVHTNICGVEYFETGISEITCLHNGKGAPCLKVMLYAEDKESAVKIAAEKRAKYLAEKDGIA